jgi:thioredoxin 2
MLRHCGSCNATNRIPGARLHESAKCGRCKAALPASATPIDVTDLATFDDIIENARVPVLVDFWAAWCGPCKMVAPEVAKVANQLAGQAIVVKVNTETLPYLAQRYRVQGIPNFAVFRGGELVRQQAGAMRADALVRLLDVRRAA